ncbi:hypothetical protein BKA70DRAFT_272171 [Coprinopsis sp. MPI-PUGE-AT-0042]|nr:hypothetical protein BKA70DRAFT_272171 [Coprinopsis sp. MPI-PUGE-AT-0042]
MKIVKFITGVSKKLAKVESWKLPSKNKTPALPAPPVDEEKAKAQPVVEEKVEEEKVEDVKLERVVEEAPIQSKKAEDDVPPPKPPGKRKALLIGIQFYPDPEAAELQEPPVAPSVPPLPSAPSGHVASTAAAANTASTATPPTADTATRTTPSLAASSSLASITSRAKAKFMQTCSISSPLASASTLPSSSFSPASPPPLVGTRKKSYAAAVSPSAGLSTAPSAWPALSSAVPVKSPITPVTPKTAAGMTSPTTPSRVPLKPGRSLVLQQQKSFVEKTAKKEKEKEKEKEKKKRKKEKSGHTHERSTSSAQSFALKGCHRDVEEMEKMLVDLYGYSPSSITTMIDTPANVQSKSHLLPTRENIITQLQELVKGAEPGDRFFFFCTFPPLSSLLSPSSFLLQSTSPMSYTD